MYYHLILAEVNGEQEYSYDYLVNAKNFNEAEKIACEQARAFYCDDDVEKNDDDWYEFFGGCLAVRVYSLAKTTKKAFVELLLSQCEIGKRRSK